MKYEQERKAECERSRKRRENKEIKSIGDLSERGKRKQRAEWRRRYHRHAKKLKKERELDEYINENSPPASPLQEPEENMQVRNRQMDKKEKKDMRCV